MTEGELAEHAGREGTSTLFDRDAVERFMNGCSIGSGRLTARRIGAGQANITFLVKRGSDLFVLRRPPPPPFPPSAHDVIREARLLIALRDSGARVPRVLALCEDESVLGVPFFLMDYIDGIVLTSSLPAALDSHTERRRVGKAVIDGLAEIHDLQWAGTTLEQFGRPTGYLERQVRRFSTLWETNATRDLSAVGAIRLWLDKNRPDTSRVTIVHGDYRLGNLMFTPSAPAKLLAVLDWEMATIGDPLADLGYLIATYSDADSPGTPLELSPVTRQPGFPSRDQMIARYQARTGHPVGALEWYEVLALWKAAVFCEAIFGRWIRGERPRDDPFASSLESGVPRLLEVASTILEHH